MPGRAWSFYKLADRFKSSENEISCKWIKEDYGDENVYFNLLT